MMLLGLHAGHHGQGGVGGVEEALGKPKLRQLTYDEM